MQKGVSPDKYRNNWGKFNETSLPEIWKILNMEDINDAGYTCKDFEVKKVRRML